MYEIGKVYVWQNCDPGNSFLNGMQTTVRGPLEDWVDQDTLEIIQAQLTSTPAPDSRSGFFVAIAGRLKPLAARHTVQCSGKVAHNTFEIAFAIGKRRGTKAYKCKFCGFWHTGGAIKNRRRNAEMEPA